MACAWGLSAQNRTYHGTVVEAANSEPVIGATIMPIGGGKGVVTDHEGKFTVSVPAKVTKIQVTYVGMKPQTLPLAEGMIVKMVNDEPSTKL